MAYADYRLCDLCEEKVFYDANLNYGDFDREAGRYKLDYLGDWAVICINCARTHRCVTIPKDEVKA